VPAAFAASLYKATRVGDSAQIDHGSPANWAADCRIHRSCAPLPVPPPCNSRLKILDLLGYFDERRVGEVVGLRGQIFRSTSWTTELACIAAPGEPSLCCNTTSAEATLVLGEVTVELPRLACVGDDSRACCNFPAFGADVVAFGTLEREASAAANTASGWFLKDAALCADSR